MIICLTLNVKGIDYEYLYNDFNGKCFCFKLIIKNVGGPF